LVSSSFKLVGEGLLAYINGQSKKCEHGGISVAAEQWRRIAVGERVVEQETTTTAGKSAAPTAPMYPILRRRQAFHGGVGTCVLGVKRRLPSTGEWGVTTRQYVQIGH